MNKNKLMAFTIAFSTFMTNVPVMAANFYDINNVPWDGAKSYINSVAANGLMVGDYDLKGNLVFRARDNISYCEVMQLVYSLVKKNTGTTVSASVQNKWTSVMNGYKIPTWAHPAVAYGLENGIITISDIPGFINSKGVAVNATRQDVAVMVGRAMKDYGTLNSNASLTYGDKSSISYIAVPYIDLLTKLSILSGDDSGNFNPKSLINRAEIAVVVSNAHNVMKKGSAESQAGSISGKITAVAPVGSNTIITVNDGSKTMSFTGNDLIPVLNGSSRVLLSSIKVDYQVVVSYQGQSLTSVLVTSTGSTSNTNTNTAKSAEGLFYSISDSYIKIKVDGSTKTYTFDDEDYSNVDFYNDGSKTTYSKFKSAAEKTKTVKLTLDKSGYVTKAELSNELTATYSSISSTYVKVKIDGSTETYYFDDRDSGNVTFRIDGTKKTYSQFKSAASSGDTVKLIIDKDDSDEITEINLVTKESGITGTFYSISKDSLKIKVDNSTKTYYYPDDDVSNTKFYVDESSKSYTQFNSAASSGNTVKIELDRDGNLSKVYLESENDNEVKGTLVSLTSTYVSVKKSGSSTSKKYYYEDDDKDNVSFYYNSSSKTYTYVSDRAESGDSVKLSLNSDGEVTKVYVSTEESSGDVSGTLKYLSSSKVKIGSSSSYILFVDSDADECSISIKDGDSRITDYDDLKEAIDDEKVFQVEATLNSDDEITKLTGYVTEARGVMTQLSTSSEYIKIKGDSSRSTFTYYFDEDDLDIDIDEGYSNNLTGLKNAFNSSDYDEIYVILTFDKNGVVTDIEAECN